MKGKTEQIIGRMAAELVRQSAGGYLLSDAFSRLARQEDLADVWAEALDRSRERPDLYGDSVLAGALSAFLHHAFHRQPEAFPALVIRILDGIALFAAVPVSPDACEKDLQDLGYAPVDLAPLFSGLKGREEDRQRNRAEAGR